MARRKAPEVIEELEDADVEELEVEDEEVEELGDDPDDSDDSESSVEGFTAKAVAAKFGTDQRTFRKFLRKKFGKVGQGKRWKISPDNLDELEAEFKTWAKGSRSETKKKQAPPIDDIDDIAELDNDELEAIEELDELEDLDFE